VVLKKWLQINLNRILHSLWSSFEEIQHRKNLLKTCQMMTLREICGTLPFLTTGTRIHSSRRIKKDLPGFLDLHNIMWVYKWQLVWQCSLNYVGKPHSRETYVKHGKCSNPSGCEMW